MTFRVRRRFASVATAALLAPVLAACGSSRTDEPVTIAVWAHKGTAAEQDTLTRQVATYNALGGATQVRLRIVNEGDYGDLVAAAAVAGTLPDVVELDGPTVPSRAYAGDLAVLDNLLPAGSWSGMLPSLAEAGRYDGKHYAVGTFESGLALYLNRRLLSAAGVEVPTRAWTAGEFETVLTKLAANDPDSLVLDLKRSYGAGEWLTYGFSPLLYSAGGGLVDRDGRAAGTLDSPLSVTAMQTLASWRNRVDPDPEDDAFVSGRVPLSWVGHWVYPYYLAALGSDLAVVPLPDFGQGSKTADGTWMWSISARSGVPRNAADFLGWLSQDAQILQTTAANGAVPGTVNALADSPLHEEGGPLHQYRVAVERACSAQAVTPDCHAVARPETPAYPVITAAFSAAVDAILTGAPVESTLQGAARRIDEDAEANHWYR